MKNAKIAVVGATGAVGREILDLLAQRGCSTPAVFASAGSRGVQIPFGDSVVRPSVLWEERHDECDVALFAANGDLAREWAPKFVNSGVAVIDNSSAFRMAENVELIVPEINADRIPKSPAIIANPNCSTILLLLGIAPLLKLGMYKIVCSTYQSVSGAGKQGFEALAREMQGGAFKPGEPFPFPIASNLFPLIGDFTEESCTTTEEQKMLDESRKILGLPDLEVYVTCVRVPVERCHSESVTLFFETDVDLKAAEDLLRNAEGVNLIDDPQLPPMPGPLSGHHEVSVGRLRKPAPKVLQLWIVGDQLLKGAALNAVQIAEKYLELRQ